MFKFIVKFLLYGYLKINNIIYFILNTKLGNYLYQHKEKVSHFIHVIFEIIIH